MYHNGSLGGLRNVGRMMRSAGRRTCHFGGLLGGNRTISSHISCLLRLNRRRLHRVHY